MATIQAELAACQVHIEKDDYISEENFYRLLDRIGKQLDQKRQKSPGGPYKHPCLAVFPEMIGAFLPIAGRASLIRGAPTTDLALTLIALRTLPKVARAMLQHKSASLNVGFLLSVAPEVRRIYREAFSHFAKQHECWVVAGSALLPKNIHGELSERFEAQEGRIYNTSYAFDPEGRAVGATRKVNLVPTLEDTLGLSPGKAEEITPFETSFGRVATLICYDGFHIPHTKNEPRFTRLAARCDAQRCAIIAQPAANPWPWEEPWVFADSGEKQLRREQWCSEGLFSQLDHGQFQHLRYAVVPQLLGSVLDNRFDGRSQILERHPSGRAQIAKEAEHAHAAPHAEDVVVHEVEYDL